MYCSLSEDNFVPQYAVSYLFFPRKGNMSAQMGPRIADRQKQVI
jgi:hypothetical protein